MNFKRVGTLPDGEPVYAMPSIAAPTSKKFASRESGCQCDPPCLIGLLTPLIDTVENLEVFAERTYTKLMGLQQVRIDSGVTKLAVDTEAAELRCELTVAGQAVINLKALLSVADQFLGEDDDR